MFSTSTVLAGLFYGPVLLLPCYHLHILITHTVPVGQAVGVEFEHANFRGREGEGLPDGVVDDVGEFAGSELGPVPPVGGTPEGVVGNSPGATVLRREVAEAGHGLLRVPVHEHLRRAAEKDVEGRGFLLAAVRDVSRQFGSQVQADLPDDRSGLCVGHGEAQFRSGDRREADDAAVTDGRQTVAPPVHP